MVVMFWGIRLDFVKPHFPTLSAVSLQAFLICCSLGRSTFTGVTLSNETCAGVKRGLEAVKRQLTYWRALV